jgi:hypothetical protein
LYHGPLRRCLCHFEQGARGKAIEQVWLNEHFNTEVYKPSRFAPSEAPLLDYASVLGDIGPYDANAEA